MSRMPLSAATKGPDSNAGRAAQSPHALPRVDPAVTRLVSHPRARLPLFSAPRPSSSRCSERSHRAHSCSKWLEGAES